MHTNQHRNGTACTRYKSTKEIEEVFSGNTKSNEIKEKEIEESYKF